MRNLLPYVGFFIGIAIGYVRNIEFAPTFAIIGAIVGYVIKKRLKEEEYNQKRAIEKYEREKEREEQSKAQRKSKAILLAHKYPEATKHYFQQHWGITKSFITADDITDERVDTLLSHEGSYEWIEQKYNSVYRAKIEAQREEEKRKEYLRKIAEEKDRIEQINSLPLCVSSWVSHHLNGEVKHKWFVDYYPYSKYKGCATDSMREAWKLVWNFKNDDSISSDEHLKALKEVIALTIGTLKSTFGDRTKFLTLVCLSASTAARTKKRYEEFSINVCSALGMRNGYAHISIVADAIPKHLGGDGMPKKQYDKSFFLGSNIILFDDVRTSGRSIVRERDTLEAMGAKVIGVITIAQTQF